MEGPPLAANETERARLVGFVADASADDLARAGSDGWTVAVLLAQVAFWDRWAEHLIHRWRRGQMPPPTVPPWYDDAMNATLLGQWRALEPPVAARLAVEAADSVDREIAQVETPVLAAIQAAGEAHLVHRHQRRREVLDQIAQILQRTV